MLRLKLVTNGVPRGLNIPTLIPILLTVLEIIPSHFGVYICTANVSSSPNQTLDTIHYTIDIYISISIFSNRTIHHFTNTQHVISSIAKIVGAMQGANLARRGRIIVLRL